MKMTLGDLSSGSIALGLILLFTVFKINYLWFLLVNFVTFLLGYYVIRKLVNLLHALSVVQLKKLFKNGLKEFSSTILFIKGNSELISNMIIGYIPFAFFLVVEQINIYRFSFLYKESTMQILHYSFKTVWYLTGAFIVPLLVNWTKNIEQIFTRGLICFIVGGILSLIPNYTVLNLVGILFLGYSHNLIFVYRKVNRRKILDNANIGFQSLGVFFAVEGLSGVFSSVYLAIFGKSLFFLAIIFIISALYLIKKNKWRSSHS